jgi:hypothetical protein
MRHDIKRLLAITVPGLSNFRAKFPGQRTMRQYARDFPPGSGQRQHGAANRQKGFILRRTLVEIDFECRQVSHVFPHQAHDFYFVPAAGIIFRLGLQPLSQACVNQVKLK